MTVAVSTGIGTFAGATLFTNAPVQSGSLIASGVIKRHHSHKQMRVRPPGDLQPAASSSLTQSLNSLSRLRQLDDGWDGESAKALTDDACVTAISILVALAIPAPPSAQLVPLHDGGVQIEWHASGNDIEVEIDSIGEVHAFIALSGGEIVLDRELPPSLLHTVVPVLKRHLVRMSRLLRDDP